MGGSEQRQPGQPGGDVHRELAVGAVPGDVAAFGGKVVDALRSVLGDELVGVWFVGSVALGGFVPSESDIDVAAVSAAQLPDTTRHATVDALVGILNGCPARGLEFSLYRRAVASAPSDGAGFEVNVNGGPRMERVTRVTADGQHGFWYVLDRAIAHRSGVTLYGPPAESVFADIGRPALLAAMSESMRWHRAHERATLYSVLNAARAWRFADEDVLGSKLEGARFVRRRWRDPKVIDAAVDLRHGRPASLGEGDVDALLDHVEQVLSGAAR
jgi:hypothetical protein